MLVLGSGVSGLSCGITLLRNGYKVTIWAEDFPPYTTSNKAAAFWYAFELNPKEKTLVWAMESHKYFEKEILTDPASGCAKRKVKNYRDLEVQDRWWNKKLKSFNKFPSNEIIDMYKYGYSYDTFVIDTSIYMNYLVENFQTLGGTMIKKKVTEIKEALDYSSIVINCTGLGSRKLFNDERVYPSRGQTIRIKPNGLDHIIIDDSGHNNFAMAAPRINDIVLGGTRQANNWNTEIDPKDTQEILRKCAQLSPLLKNVEIIGEAVGLRPVRDEIRLEAENYSGKTVIHNYGHGGSGFSASWGCANSVLELVSTFCLP